jgi:hypothetical protein
MFRHHETFIISDSETCKINTHPFSPKHIAVSIMYKVVLEFGLFIPVI